MARIAALALVALLIQALVAAPVSAATPQEITFEPDADGRVGDVLVLDATADSGLGVTYATSTPTTCSIEVDGLHLDAVGTCSVTASQAGDDDFLPATDVIRAVTIKPALIAQTITFDPPASGVTGGTVPLFAVATSGRPVNFATTTPGTCSINGTTLRLLATGTCSVTASQAGGDPYAAAPDVVRDIEISVSPITTASGANLGRYAFNGAIVDSVIDPSTGITYVGGAFNQVGIRTGNVAVVEGPDAGGDGIRSSNPDVVGEAVAVFPDDASGYFMSGHISSINGDGVSRAGIVRMTSAGKLDPTWSAPDVCELGDMWDLGKWIGVRVRMSGDTDGFSTLGLQLVSKATGKAYMTGAGTQRCGASGRMWSATGPFAPLGGSDSDILDVTMDASTSTLVMRVSDAYVVAYDMTTGARRWSYPLVGLPSDVSAFGGVVLLTGELQPEFDIASMSSLILLDGSDGTVLQRWNPSGEQDLADPTQTTGPSTSCLPANDGLRNYVRHEFAHVEPETAIGYGVPSGTGLTRTVPVCRYSVTGSGHGARLVATDLGTLTAHADPFAFFQLPSTPYLGRYLVGGYDAFDLQTGTQVPDWHPEPSVGIDLRTTVVGHDVVFGGPFTFTHGQAAEHVAAVDDSLSPVDDFDVDLPDTEQSSAGQQEVRALSLVGDTLMVVGDLKSDDGRGPVVALDATSGDRTWALIPDDLSIAWSVAPAAVGGGFYLGTIWPVADLPILSRFVPDGGDFTPDGTWTPDLAAMDGLAPSVTELALIDDRLYVGGSFGSIDGATRHGLARFSDDGTLDDWAPSLLEEADLGIKPSDVQPHAFVEMGDVVVVGGTHRFYAGTPPATETSAIQMFSSTTGERIRPTGSDAPWYPGAVYAIYDVDLAGGILYGALGSGGIGAFDATTFDYLPSRSIRTQPGWGNNEVYSISVRPEAAAFRVQDVGDQPSVTMVVGGALPHWEGRSAANVVEVVGEDRTAPGIRNAVPGPLAMNVARDAKVAVRFSESVTGATAGVTLTDASTNAKVSATATYDASTLTVTIKPKALLTAGRTFRVKVADTIADGWGNPAGAVSWTFKVSSDKTKPKVTKHSPRSGATGVSRTANVIVKFSEAVRVSATKIRLKDVSTGKYVTAKVTLSSSKKTATLNPSKTLKSSHRYMVVVSGVTDLAGNPITKTTWTYKTRR